MKLLSIDPSINFCGFAFFNDKFLVEAGVLLSDKVFTEKLHWTQKAFSIFYKYQSLITTLAPDKIVIEMPTVWYTARGHGAKTSGALEKLFFITGLLVSQLPEAVTLITPLEWKGQQPKSVTESKVKKVFPNLNYLHSHNADMIDAIGLGLYFIEKQPTFQVEQNNLRLDGCSDDDYPLHNTEENNENE